MEEEFRVQCKRARHDKQKIRSSKNTKQKFICEFEQKKDMSQTMYNQTVRHTFACLVCLQYTSRLEIASLQVVMVTMSPGINERLRKRQKNYILEIKAITEAIYKLVGRFLYIISTSTHRIQVKRQVPFFVCACYSVVECRLCLFLTIHFSI